MIVIVDYGTGNLKSIFNMLKKIGIDSMISSDKGTLLKADKLILPGVGAFDNAMKNIIDLDLYDVLNDKVTKQKTPILGICLGMQLMTNGSSEGKMKGLSWINAYANHFKQSTHVDNLRVPHMGWNSVYPIHNNTLFYNMVDEELKFYFVHSYYIECNEVNDILATTTYGLRFTSAFHRDNIFGVQFHPEKSHTYGKRILKNFIERC